MHYIFLDDVYFEIISYDKNNCGGNEAFDVAKKLSSVNDTNDDLTEDVLKKCLRPKVGN